MSFKDLLDMPLDQVEKPPLIPQGSYDSVVSGVEKVTSSQKKTDGMRVKVRLNSPREDVDAELLQDPKIVERINKFEGGQDFWITADALHRLKEFLEAILGDDANGKSVSQCLAILQDRPCIAVIKHLPNKDNSDMFAIVDKLLPPE